MRYLIGFIGIMVGAAGFWMDFASHPDMATDSPLGSAWFDIGAAGILVATLSFMIQMVVNALPRRRQTAIVVPEAQQV
jgi:hypothetical protein